MWWPIPYSTSAKNLDQLLSTKIGRLTYSDANCQANGTHLDDGKQLLIKDCKVYHTIARAMRYSSTLKTLTRNIRVYNLKTTTMKARTVNKVDTSSAVLPRGEVPILAPVYQIDW